MSELLNAVTVARIEVLSNGCLLVIPAHLAAAPTPAPVKTEAPIAKTEAPVSPAPVSTAPANPTPPRRGGRRKPATETPAPAPVVAPAAPQVTAPKPDLCKHLMPVNQCANCHKPAVSAPPPAPESKVAPRPEGKKRGKKPAKKDDETPIEVPLKECAATGYYKTESGYGTVLVWHESEEAGKVKLLWYKDGESHGKHKKGGFDGWINKLRNCLPIEGGTPLPDEVSKLLPWHKS